MKSVRKIVQLERFRNEQSFCVREAADLNGEEKGRVLFLPERALRELWPQDQSGRELGYRPHRSVGEPGDK